MTDSKESESQSQSREEQRRAEERAEGDVVACPYKYACHTRTCNGVYACIKFDWQNGVLQDLESKLIYFSDLPLPPSAAGTSTITPPGVVWRSQSSFAS